MVLSAWILAALVATTQSASGSANKTCPDGSVILEKDHCLELPDHRTQFSLPPPVLTLTTEWSCGKSGKPSEAKVRITDKTFINERGERILKRLFEVGLLSLRIKGTKASEAKHRKVRDALRSFDQVTILQGRCLQAQPTLFIRGFEWDGLRMKDKRAEIEL